MPPSITLKHPADDLGGKDIKFRVRSFRGEPVQEVVVEGTGTLLVDVADEAGKFEAVIDVSVPPDSPSGVGTWQMHQIPLDQRAADCLEIAEDGTLLCVDPSLPNA